MSARDLALKLSDAMECCDKAKEKKELAELELRLAEANKRHTLELCHIYLAGWAIGSKRASDRGSRQP